MSESVGTLTREELYEKVWSQEMTKLAKSYGIPTANLAKICRKQNVPTPSRGYWWRLEIGLPTDRIPLPALEAVSEKTPQASPVEKPTKPQMHLTENRPSIVPPA
jgi:hypothetical protein